MLAKIKSLLKSKSSDKIHYDMVCLTNHGTSGWILGAIAREVAHHLGDKVKYHQGYQEIPAAKCYFYLNWHVYVDFFIKNKNFKSSKEIVYFTHPRDIGVDKSKIIEAMNASHKVIFMNSGHMRDFIKEGLDPDRCTYLVGAVDPGFFKARKRTGNGAVGFVTAYYDRKNPQLVLNLVKRMPNRNFILLGKDWNEWPHFNELISCKNLEYVETEYKNYPSYYSKMDVFVSPAFLEGGPIPLLESMISNVVPIASTTGFAPDIINHGQNGYLFDPNTASVEDVSVLIDKAYDDTTTDIRASAMDYSWECFSKNVYEIAFNQ